MDPEAAEVFQFIMRVMPMIALIVAISVGGWVFTTWLRVKNGYPLETSWGTPLHPKSDNETKERIRLLTTENAQLRAEIGSMKDRLQNVERIVTDQPSRLSKEIEALSVEQSGHA